MQGALGGCPADSKICTKNGLEEVGGGAARVLPVTKRQRCCLLKTCMCETRPWSLLLASSPCLFNLEAATWG